MEAVSAILGVSEMALRTGSKLWEVSCAWRDAPEELHLLRDDMARTQRFFGETQHGLAAIYTSGTGAAATKNTHHAAESRKQQHQHTKGSRDTAYEGDVAADSSSRRDLQRLLDKGASVLRVIEGVVDSLARGSNNQSDSKLDSIKPDIVKASESLSSSLRELGKRRRIIWMANARKISRLRKELGDIVTSVCRLLIVQNV